MESHPPLCPGTEGLCLDGNGDLRGDYRRVWMARYQACAWQDREKELWNMSYTLTYVAEGFMNRGIESMPHSPDAHCAALQASINAAAWREWERDA